VANLLRHHQTILISCEIPWDEQEQLDQTTFRHEIRHFLSLGFRDLYIFGTAGEGYAVDTDRFRAVVDVFREETDQEGVTAMVGVIGLSTANVIERLAIAHEAGFRYFQISLPSWGMLDQSETMRFFGDVCESFPDSRFLHYNLVRSRRLIGAAEYRRIADRIPNLVATKNTGTTVAGTVELMRSVPQIQHFFGEAMFPTGCLFGECSLLSSFGPMMPSRTWEFFEAGRTRQIDRLFRLQAEYLTTIADIQRPIHGTDKIDGAYDKMWVRLGGVPMPLRLLSPYESFTEDVFEQCRQILHDKYREWMG
jgi:dihydrodipicolinate synthase/N-acetylneuraminate lyase